MQYWNLFTSISDNRSSWHMAYVSVCLFVTWKSQHPTKQQYNCQLKLYKWNASVSFKKGLSNRWMLSILSNCMVMLLNQKSFFVYFAFLNIVYLIMSKWNNWLTNDIETVCVCYALNISVTKINKLVCLHFFFFVCNLWGVTLISEIDRSHLI